MRRLSAPLLAASLGACLPEDNRPPPATVFVRAEPGAALVDGFETGDGWRITFDRFVTAIGSVDLDDDPDGPNDSCNAYSNARYDRTFDFTQLERSKVGLVYGLGRCSVEYRFRAPSDDTILGPGVTEELVTQMRVEASDDYADSARTSLLVSGEATRGGETKRFSWTFRRGFELDRCEAPAGDYLTVVDLGEGDRVDFTVVVLAEELFRVAPSDESPVEFDRFAAADADGDGDITFEELALVEAPDITLYVDPEGLGGDDDDDDPVELPETMADLVYELNLPRVTRVAGGGPCKTDER